MLPNQDIINYVFNQISKVYTNRNLRFISGHGRGAQAAMYSMVHNPDFSKNMILTELYITNGPATKIDINNAKFLINKLESDVKVNIINGNDDWLNIYTDAIIQFVRTCNPEIIECEKQDLSSMSCFQYGFMDVLKNKIERIWKELMKSKYNENKALEMMTE